MEPGFQFRAIGMSRTLVAQSMKCEQCS